MRRHSSILSSQGLRMHDRLISKLVPFAVPVLANALAIAREGPAETTSGAAWAPSENPRPIMRDNAMHGGGKQ